MNPAIRQRTRYPPRLWIALAAIVMGLPTLRGGFVGGDDHRLVLDHVLVNHPSVDNAVKLFTIVHRDLYQPLPLLTFSGEFALASIFGWMHRGEEGGTWVFHLTNALLHALNTVLVWYVVFGFHRSMRTRESSALDDVLNGTETRVLDSGSRAIATIAALLFAIHPLQVETVAWINGRMMLLSTLFGLLAIRSFSNWLAKPAAAPALVCILCVLFSAISKVRVGLPLLLLLVPIASGLRPVRRWFSLWFSCLALTAVFVGINVWTTASADLFSDGAEHLRGPRLLRVLLALAFYLQHLVWPTGLASYYPTPPQVQWSDPQTLPAAAIVLSCAVPLLWGCTRSRACRFGVLWFLFGIGDTLPFFPARNVLAADRYVYLPIVGLFWIIAEAALAAGRRMAAGRPIRTVRAIMISTSIAVCVALTAQSWYTAYWYNAPILKTERVARLFPDVPRVWERLGWSFHAKGDYDKAMDCAQKELVHDHPNVRSGAYQLMGFCLLDKGLTDEATQLLEKAIQVDPHNDIGHFRLGAAYERVGRMDDAVPLFEKAATLAPGHNPSLHRLAAAYRRLGRPADARAIYERILLNNSYDATAVGGLAELDIAEGTPQSLAAAERRLRGLLGELPESIEAAVNLGVVLVAMGQTREAVDVYETVLKQQPDHLTATLNLAQLYHQARDDARAAALFDRLSKSELPSGDQKTVVQDYSVFKEQWGRATSALAALSKGQSDEAWTNADAMCSGHSGGHRDARRRLLDALQKFDEEHAGNVWTYALAARLLIAENRLDPARAFADLFDQSCRDESCREKASLLRNLLEEKKAVP